MTSPAERFRQRSARRRPQTHAAEGAPFSSFLERHEERVRKSRNKRRMLLVSVAVHVVVFGVLLLLSAWKVEELFGPTVEVRVIGDGEGGQPERSETGRRLNVGRTLGLRWVVTPQGVQTLPRSDLEPAVPEVRAQLESVVAHQILPALAYPDAARPLRLRGAVTALVRVDSQGQPTGVSVKEPCLHPLLCTAAQRAAEAVTSWPREVGPGTIALPVEYRF